MGAYTKKQEASIVAVAATKMKGETAGDGRKRDETSMRMQGSAGGLRAMR